MPSIGVRELKNHAPEIMRLVREERAEYIVTYRGEPVAMLLPLDKNWRELITAQQVATIEPSRNVWSELDELRREIDREWQSEKSAVELLIEQRG
jgi:prevent-host-death family protein